VTAIRRGFKTEANDIARQVRQELGLRLADPLDPLRLAEYLGIPVVPLTDFHRDAPDVVRHFTKVNRKEFSGVTVFRGPARLIVFNDSHSDGRQASDLAHELAHALLQHPPGPALDGSGCRDWDQELEEEANWLAGALLVSDEAAIAVARSRMSIENAARKYGISPKMMQFRLNVSGAQARVQRARW
jgi:Zn-dependent peptidase ImmA (M78 family)